MTSALQVKRVGHHYVIRVCSLEEQDFGNLKRMSTL